MGERFEVIAGARRFRAAQIAALSEISARILDVSDDQTLELQIVELSIVVKRFLFVYAGSHVVSM
jgi:ParB-like chromosome segregation protein Spo0J